jgi:hypothetical protein
MEKWVDLHTHTNCSDGELTPTELVCLAMQSGLSAIAITDHDCVFGVEEAIEAGLRLGITIVPGIELSTEYNGITIHIAGLFIDPNNTSLISTITSAQKEVMKRNQIIFDKLALMGFNDLSIEDLQLLLQIKVPVRWHICKYLEIKGYVANVAEAREKYIGKGKMAYVESTHKTLTVYEAISLIHSAGGLAFLAHPNRYGLDDSELAQIMLCFKEMGIDGIETYHSENTVADVKYLLDFAKTNNLLISGGSDFHGFRKPDVKLGIVCGKSKIPHSVLSTLLHVKNFEVGYLI